MFFQRIPDSVPVFPRSVHVEWNIAHRGHGWKFHLLYQPQCYKICGLLVAEDHIYNTDSHVWAGSWRPFVHNLVG